MDHSIKFRVHTLARLVQKIDIKLNRGFVFYFSFSCYNICVCGGRGTKRMNWLRIDFILRFRKVRIDYGLTDRRLGLVSLKEFVAREKNNVSHIFLMLRDI